MNNEIGQIEINFGAKDSEVREFEYTIPEGYEAEIKDGKVIIRKKESNDKKIRKALHIYLDWLDGKKDVAPRGEYSIGDMIAWVMKQKPADKVEPKFKVGDWVVDKYGCVNQILSFRNGVYKHTRGYSAQVFEEDWHLWTIQDAKDGDVLAMNLSEQNNWIGIFKEIDGCTFKTYCFLNRNGGLVTNTKYCKGHGTHKVFPATKEQCDAIFAKIKEVGYEWDSENKELKKIEQKPVELPKGEDYGIDDLYAAIDILKKTLGKVDGYQTDDGILEHKCAISAVKKLYEQKPAWSEEDVVMLNKLLAVVDLYYNRSGNDLDKQSCISWLKSLRPQNRWKPSEKQIMSLYNSIPNAAFCERETLTQLYVNLKKLREE